ncbi:hypothetical protein Bbelb_093990 [Branchiostoma belcheri]|nr:hypothetical protein Bbelb_093990 [Branchiostoma belcheri]
MRTNFEKWPGEALSHCTYGLSYSGTNRDGGTLRSRSAVRRWVISLSQSVLTAFVCVCVVVVVEDLGTTNAWSLVATHLLKNSYAVLLITTSFLERNVAEPMLNWRVLEKPGISAGFGERKGVSTDFPGTVG